MRRALSYHRTLIILAMFGLTFVVQPDARASEQPGDAYVPMALQGAWFGGQSCASSGTYEFLGRNWMVGINPKSSIEDGRSGFQIWGGTFNGLYAKSTNSMIYKQPWIKTVKGQIHVEKGQSIFKADGSNHAERKFFSPADAPTGKLLWVRCKNFRIPSKFWKGQVAYLKNITQALTLVNNIDDGCQSSAESCENAVFNEIDINKNKEISKAELITFIRKISILLLFDQSGKNVNSISSIVDPQDIVYVQLGASVVGPIIARYVMANVDYNGNGDIEPAELLLFMRSLGLPLSDHLVFSILQNGIQDGSQIMENLRNVGNSAGMIPGLGRK